MFTLLAFDLRNTYLQDNPINNVSSIWELVSQILPNAYIIAGLILFIYLVAGGFMITSSAGNPEVTKNGQKIISNAIIGFIILFCSYWLIQIIEILTGVNILTPNSGLI